MDCVACKAKSSLGRMGNGFYCTHCKVKITDIVIALMGEVSKPDVNSAVRNKHVEQFIGTS